MSFNDFCRADADEFITAIDPLDEFDRQEDEGSMEDCCSECGTELVHIQDEYSDAIVCPECECDVDEYDGQPSEYDEWQDYMGGDDWDHGQYDEY
jgi:hypothetical protein